MRVNRSGIVILAMAAVIGFAQLALGADADELALSERIAALADRFGNSAATGPYKQALYEAAGRLADREIRFRRSRFRAAELSGDADGMLASLQEWRKLEPANLFVQMRLIDVYLTKLQTADARLNYAKQVVEAENVDAQVRSHAAVQMARLQFEQSRQQAAMESLRKAVLLNGLNKEALTLQWELSINGSTPIQRVTLLLAMLKADPGSVDSVVRMAQELSYLNMVQPSLLWYAQANTMSASLGGLAAGAAKDYAAELLIAGQDRGAAEIGSRLLERESSDPGAWFLTLLAERNIKERIELVKKNALIGLLNRLAVPRAAMGAKDATTRPLGADEVSLPNFAGDVELLKKATPEQRREYATAASDVAWFLVYHDDKPAETSVLIQAISAADDADKDLQARLQGWVQLKQGKTDEARKTLTAVADRDPLAAIGLLRILRKDPASVTAATDLTRRLTHDFPARLLGAYVRAETGPAADEASADPTIDAIRDLLDRFPREIFRMSTAPQEFITMRLQPQQVGHDFAEPMLVDIELRNLRDYPLVIGGSGMTRDVWLDAQMRGLLQQWVSGVSYEKSDGPVILAPGSAMRWTVRLDRGPLADLLDRGVQQALQLSVFGLTNAVPTDQGVVPGPCGIRGRMSQMMERRAASLASDAAMRRARATLDANDPVSKLRLADQVAAHLRVIADPQSADAVKAMDPEFRDLLLRLAQDSSVAVRGWSRLQMARMMVEPAEKTASDLSSDAVWYVRVLAAVATMETSPTARNTVLAKLLSDQDATVRHLAQAIPAAMEKPQEAASPGN